MCSCGGRAGELSGSAWRPAADIRSISEIPADGRHCSGVGKKQRVVVLLVTYYFIIPLNRYSFLALLQWQIENSETSAPLPSFYTPGGLQLSARPSVTNSGHPGTETPIRLSVSSAFGSISTSFLTWRSLVICFYGRLRPGLR